MGWKYLSQHTSRPGDANTAPPRTASDDKPATATASAGRPTPQRLTSYRYRSEPSKFRRSRNLGPAHGEHLSRRRRLGMCHMCARQHHLHHQPCPLCGRAAIVGLGRLPGLSNCTADDDWMLGSASKRRASCLSSSDNSPAALATLAARQPERRIAARDQCLALGGLVLSQSCSTDVHQTRV